MRRLVEAWRRRPAAIALRSKCVTGNSEARALYANLGFVEVGRRVDYYGPGEAAILMRLDLPV